MIEKLMILARRRNSRRLRKKIGAEHQVGGALMDILAFGERLQQIFILGKMGHDPQFDLGIIGRQQQPVRAGDKGPAQVEAGYFPDRDVLQVGIG